MDPRSLKEEALYETARFFAESRGGAPDPDSEEWEDEYRRQFELVKRRHAREPAGSPHRAESAAGADERPNEGPRLTGPDAERRWALTLRAERLKEIRNAETRHWLVETWVSSKDWVGTRTLSPAMFLHKVETLHAAYRRRAETQARTAQVEEQRKAEAAAVLDRQIREAGITQESLVALIDVSPRARAVPAQAKIADLTVGDRSLRVFETSDLTALVVIEKGPTGRSEYVIERDAGLAADLSLYARQVNGR
jgi:hypothetical protein